MCREVNAESQEVRVVSNSHLKPFVLTTLNHADWLKCVVLCVSLYARRGVVK